MEITAQQKAIRSGYKQTEAGVIPNDWEVKALSEVATIATGNTPSTSISENYGDEYLFVSPADLGDQKCISDTEKKLSKKGFSVSRRFPPESILFTCIGSTIGKCGIAQIELTSNQQINAIFPAKGFSNEYLYYELSFLSPRIKALAAVQAVPIINKSQFGETEVAFPALPEQRAIAEALNDVDELIGALDKLIAKKRDLKQAVMQQLLYGKQRLPGFDGEWEDCQIRDIADVRTGPFGSSLHERDYVDDGTPIITVEHLDEFGVLHSNLPMVSEADRQRLEAYALEEHDIVFSRVGSIDRNALIRSAEAGWLFSGRLLRLRLNRKKAFAPYLSYQFHTVVFKLRVKSVAVGQTMPSLNTQILNGIDVVLPSLPEQEAIAAVLSDMDADIVALEKRRDKTRDIKQGMMQELLTGKTRLI